MIESISLPEELLINTGTESREFAVKGKRAQPLFKSIPTVIFGVVWLAFISLIASIFFIPSALGEDAEVINSGVSEGAGSGNMGPELFPAIFIGVFFLIGIFILGGGLISLLKSGAYFVGTPARLVSYKKGFLKSTDWEQFTGDITVFGTNKKGSIYLTMRTGEMIRGKGGSRYVPDVVFICGVPGVYEIEQICRKRIKENDPTPGTI